MDLFTEGQKLALFFRKNSSIIEMTCVIEKVYDDRLDLTLPQYFMRYIEFLQVGSEFMAKAFSKLGTVDFNTVVICSPLEETFTIEMDYNCVKLTPGETLPTIKAVEFLEIITEADKIRVKTFELSTEFIKFTSNHKFSVGDAFNGVLILPKNYGKIEFKGVVSEIDPIYDTEYTAQFVTITETAKQNLLYYMYMYTKDND